MIKECKNCNLWNSKAGTVGICKYLDIALEMKYALTCNNNYCCEWRKKKLIKK
jgi:hypothetical protein